MTIKRTQKALNKFTKDLDRAVEKSLDKIVLVAQKHAKKTNLFKGNSPNGLRNNIKIIKNGQYSRTLLADKNYAFYVEEGNNQKGPWIYPKRAKYLHFWIGGKEFFCKRVRSHGKLPFMERAMKYAESKALSIIEEEIKKIL